MTQPPAPVGELGYQVNSIANARAWWLSLDEEQTPELRWPLSIWVYERMAIQDAQVASVMRALTYPVMRTRWWVNQAGARDEVTEHIAADLGLPIKGQDPKPPPRTRDRFSWREHLRMALLMLRYGHSYFEPVYRVLGDQPGQTHLRKLAWRPPKTISQIDVARDGGLVGIRQDGPSGVGEVKIPVNRLVAYVHEREGGNWYGRSILRSAYKYWLLKDRLLRVNAQTIERNGMGVPRYTAAEDETDLAKGLKMATEWRSGEAAGAAIPAGAKLDLVGVTGTTPDALPAIRYYDEQIGRALLAHFLNLGQQTGSWALGTTFADFFTLSLDTVSTLVGDTASQHIVEDLVDANWGEDEPAPLIEPQEIGQQQTLTANAIKMLLDSGALSSDPPLEQALRQQYGLPPAQDRAPTAPELLDDGGPDA